MAMNPRLLRPLASGFNPRQIAGLAGWWDAADLTTMAQNSDGTVAASSASDPVGYWADKSGNGRHAKQATSGKRPAVQLADINGKAGLDFDGSDDYFACDSGANFAAAFAIAVMRRTGTPPAYAGVYVHRGAASGAGFTNSAQEFYVATASGRPTRLFGLTTAGGLARLNGSTSATVNNGQFNLHDAELVPNTTDTNVIGVQGNIDSTVGTQYPFIGLDPSSVTRAYPMRLYELLVFENLLSTADLQRVEGYLAWKWGLQAQLPSNHPYAYSFPGFGSQARPDNADALDWESAVYANSGSVSVGTLAAVNTFANAIDAAGIRDRFYRLNLFCGDSDASLVAVRTPLYRGPSRTGTQYGGTTDTNNNFVQGDYAETGASGGLIGNTTTKYLDTGLAPDALPSAATGHLSFWTRGGSVAGVRRPIGTDVTTTAQRFFMDRRPVANGGDLIHWGSLSAGQNTDDDSAGLFSGSRVSSTDLRFFKNGVQEGATQTGAATITAHDKPWFVFAGNSNGTPANYYERRLAAYSIGDGMTAAQMLSYYNAVNAFMGALSRT